MYLIILEKKVLHLSLGPGSKGPSSPSRLGVKQSIETWRILTILYALPVFQLLQIRERILNLSHKVVYILSLFCLMYAQIFQPRYSL